MKFIRSKKFIIIAAIVVFFAVRHVIVENNAVYIPDYERVDISFIEDGELTDEDYTTLFYQTGLSPWAADVLIDAGMFERIYSLQDTMFEPGEYEKNYIAFPITCEERRTDTLVSPAPYKKGDIIVTFNTRTLDWRHGHVGLIVDNASMLEHMSIGSRSCLSSPNSFGIYPAYIVLRYHDPVVAENAADYAKNSLVGIPYNIFAGISDKDMSDNVNVTDSHCSHIIWQAFKAAGADIDSNGSPVVTPANIVCNNALSVVRIVGMNPAEYAGRVVGGAR